MFRQSLNQREFSYKNYLGKTPVISQETGLPNGEYTQVWGKLNATRGNISAPTGRMLQDTFGWNIDFDLVIVPSDNLMTIAEGSAVYIDGTEYQVVRVGRTLNETVIAVKNAKQGA